MMEWTNLIIAAVGGGGVATIIVSIVNGLFSKKKLDAEATDIISKAASGVVTDLRAEIERLEKARREESDRADHARREERDRMNAMVRAWDTEREEFRRVLQLHVAWDMIAISKMSEIGVSLPPAPPLMPAIRISQHDDSITPQETDTLL